jgi:ribosomal-protein-alanine N-acetyltransferase
MVKNDLPLMGNKVEIKRFLASDISNDYISWLNDKNIMRYSNQRFLVHSMDSCLQYYAAFEGSDNLFMGIHRLSDNKLIGTMTAYISKNNGTVDVGIMVGDQCVWGMGYGLDAWITVTNWLLTCQNIRKLTAGTVACNFGMIKLIERSGMILEATRKAQKIIDGCPVDVLYYAKFNGN